MSNGIEWAWTASGDRAIYLEGKRVGTIVRMSGERYAYLPKGKTRADLDSSQVYPTFERCLSVVTSDE